MKEALPRTRLIEAPSLGPRVFLKLESEMPTGSFKVRGALYSLSVQPKSVTHVVASSTGNHGAAVAWAAKRLGIRATIFLPQNPNPVKKANIVRHGAEVVEGGRDLSEAFEAVTAFVSQTGAFLLNDATDPDLPNGPAAIADEIVDDCPDVDVIYVPIGDSALIRSVAASAKKRKPSVRIVGIQAEAAPSYVLSWREGRVVSTPTALTMADGLATRTPVEENVHAIRALVDDMRLVSEDAMIAAVGRLIVDEHIVAEPSAASTAAAFLAEREEARTGTTVLVITGCNIQPELLRAAVEGATRD